MKRLVFATLSVLTLSALATSPALALNERFDDARSETINRLTDRFDDARDEIINKLNDRFSDSYKDNLNR